MPPIKGSSGIWRAAALEEAGSSNGGREEHVELCIPRLTPLQPIKSADGAAAAPDTSIRGGVRLCCRCVHVSAPVSARRVESGTTVLSHFSVSQSINLPVSLSSSAHFTSYLAPVRKTLSLHRLNVSSFRIQKHQQCPCLLIQLPLNFLHNINTLHCYCINILTHNEHLLSYQ